MKHFHTIKKVQACIKQIKEEDKTLGFVPTMGALHEGHLALVKQAQKECDYVMVSIFVNPKQFNNSEDLKTYPRHKEKDVELLKRVECDFVFSPEVEEMYPGNFVETQFNFEHLNQGMEGKHRPNHFQGVVDVLRRFFSILLPNKVYFGRKDFQQVTIVKKLVKDLHLPHQIKTVATVRDSKGLARSSRNLLLTAEELDKATQLYEVLQRGKEWAVNNSPSETLDRMKDYFNENDLHLDYLQLVHPETLVELDKDWVPGATACIAAYCGKVRLIDNMELIPLKELAN